MINRRIDSLSIRQFFIFSSSIQALQKIEAIVRLEFSRMNGLKIKGLTSVSFRLEGAFEDETISVKRLHRSLSLPKTYRREAAAQRKLFSGRALEPAGTALHLQESLDELSFPSTMHEGQTETASMMLASWLLSFSPEPRPMNIIHNSQFAFV